MKRGRPKDIGKAQNRVHSIVLTEIAEIKYREICSIRGQKKWLNKEVNEYILSNYSNGKEAILKKEIYDLQIEGEKIYERVRQKAEELKELK